MSRVFWGLQEIVGVDPTEVNAACLLLIGKAVSYQRSAISIQNFNF